MPSSSTRALGWPSRLPAARGEQDSRYALYHGSHLKAWLTETWPGFEAAFTVQ